MTIQKKKEIETLPSLNSYTSTQIKSLIIIQSWWRGRMTRSWIAATLITQRLRYKGCTIKEIKKTTDSIKNPLLKPKQSNTTKFLLAHSRNNRHSNDVDSTVESEASLPGPWPRQLVRELCQFLDAIQHRPDLSSSNGRSFVIQPSDLPEFGGDCSTMARVYRTQEIRMLKSQPFAFGVEKRALKQLEDSRKERQLLIERMNRKKI